VKIRGIGRIRRGALSLKGRFTRRVVILLYHRVTEFTLDPHLLCVTPEHFAEHLEMLRSQYRVTKLDRLVHAVQEGDLSSRGVVVTFDDGYANNLSNAKPLLERYDVPATVFVTAGYVGGEGEFWWDELDRLLLQPGTLPETLRLSLNGTTYQWELGEVAHYSEDAFRSHFRWNVLEKDNPPSPRQRLYFTLHQLLRPLPKEERKEILDELLAWAGAQTMARPTHRTLSPDEVVQLIEGGLIQVGAHTVSHPVLSALPAAAQRAEIQEGKARLEEILGHSVTSFAYPYGSRSDYTSETVTAVREAKFTCACSNFAGVVWRGIDHFQLPRFVVRDWNGEEFSRRLWEWFRS